MAPPLIWQAPWLTPNCLNTATAAQSMIDAWNRQRQDQLGMHDTFHVKSYHKRFTEFMITACMVNGNNATVYHLPQYKGTHFRHNMQELAHQMINNKEFKEWLHSSGGGAPGPSGATKSATRSGHVFISPSKDGPIGMVSIDGGPPTRDSPAQAYPDAAVAGQELQRCKAAALHHLPAALLVGLRPLHWRAFDTRPASPADHAGLETQVRLPHGPPRRPDRLVPQDPGEAVGHLGQVKVAPPRPGHCRLSAPAAPSERAHVVHRS